MKTTVTDALIVIALLILFAMLITHKVDTDKRLQALEQSQIEEPRYWFQDKP